VGTALGVAIGGAAMAQNLRKPVIAHPMRALLVDHEDKHGKHFGKRNEAEDEDENEGRGRRSARSWPGTNSPSSNYYGSSRPYSPYNMPPGYGYYGQPPGTNYYQPPYYRGY
jgi:hypothetical protein